MRILIGLSFLFLIGTNCYSQKGKQFAIYSTIGAKAGFGLSSIKNENIKADGNVQMKSGFGNTYGFKTSLNYIGKSPKYTLLGFHGDYLFGNYPLELKEIKIGNSKYSKSIDLKTRDIIITFRYINAAKGFFIEAGPQISSFRSVSQTNLETDSIYNLVAYSNEVYSNQYTQYNNFVIGAGMFIKRFVFSFRYSLPIGSINIQGSNPVSDGYYNSTIVNPAYESSYQAGIPTKHSSLMFTIEFYIPFLTFGRSSCGNSGFSFFRGVDTGYFWGRKDYYYN